MKGNHNRHPHTKQIFCSHHQTTCKLHKSWINYSLHHLSLKIEKKVSIFFYYFYFALSCTENVASCYMRENEFQRLVQMKKNLYIFKIINEASKKCYRYTCT